VRYREGAGLADIVRQYTQLRRMFLAMYVREDTSHLNEWLSHIGFVNECLDEAISACAEQLASEATRDRDILIAAVGHDLGNEIAVIRIATARMLSEMSLAPTVRDRATIVSNSGQLMARMVCDLADFAHVPHCGGLSVQRRPCDASVVCREVVAGALVGRASHDVSICSSGPAIGRWDPDRLTQLVRNLVSNALEHGQGQVVVSVGPANDAAWVRIAVSNHGPVIPAGTRPKLFRAHPSGAPGARQRLRLGLFMVKTIAQAHGGRVSFDSVENGTTFIVSLPVDGETPSASN
jgi:phosphoserine phosphatase RsbU/P